MRDGALIESAARGPLPKALIDRLRPAKPEFLATLADPAEWRARHGVALAHWLAFHPQPEADRSPGAGCRLRGIGSTAPAPEWQCAGCDAPIGGSLALTLQDENRVHFDEKSGCLIAFGRRWRGAVAGLQASGIGLPAGFELS